ncbi:MAG: PD40 domain-containing protein [Saprospiraceae bacterium]|nr:PD40 domain-containing protein [Saprospiraceae bacterium]
MTEGPLFNSDRIDIHYNSVDKTIKPIFISDYQENHISVDPRGDNLIYVSNRSGNHEIWCYNLSSHQVKQITNGATYS